MSTPSLFDPINIGTLQLKNRVVMAPLTRSRATADGMPTELMEVYYSQRASAGLIVSEGIVISPQGAAYPRVPGLYNKQQEYAWRSITDAVHDNGGLIYAQLWHVGRQSHSSVQPDGLPPYAPSPIPIKNFQYYRKPDRLDYETPRQMTKSDIRNIALDYATAARRALDAGFDGVELHGANGYLIDQFLNSGSNLRTDEYGGDIAGRAKFLHEVITQVGKQIPLSRVGVRLSPSSRWMDAIDEDKMKLHSFVVESLNAYNLAYLHLVEPQIAGSTTSSSEDDAVPVATLSKLFDGTVITTGDHDLTSAEESLSAGTADLVGFGRKFIANPDLPARLQCNLPLNNVDKKGLYGGEANGYITYPSFSEEQQWKETRSSIDSGALDPGQLWEQLAKKSTIELARNEELYSFIQLRSLFTASAATTT